MSYDTEVLADTPWVYYKTDEASGNLADSSGNGITGSVQPSVGGLEVYAQTGPSGAADAIYFPATAANYFSIANATQSTGTHGITFEAWVYLTALPAVNVSVIGQGTTAGTQTTNTELGLSIDTSARPVLYMYNTAYRLLTGTALSLNAWHHIVGVASCTTGMRLRVDKNADGTLAQNALTSTYVRKFGIREYGYATGAAAITISKPAIYKDVALTDTRIDAHFDAMGVVNAPVNITGTWGLVS